MGDRDTIEEFREEIDEFKSEIGSFAKKIKTVKSSIHSFNSNAWNVDYDIYDLDCQFDLLQNSLLSLRDSIDRYSQAVNCAEFVPLYEKEEFSYLLSSLENGFRNYIARTSNEVVNRFWEELESDLKLFAEGKPMKQVYTFSLDIGSEENAYYIGFDFEEDYITISCGGSVYDPSVGSDSFTNWTYSIDIDGYSESRRFDYSSCDEILSLFMDERAVLSIEEPEEYCNDEEDN